MVQSVFLTGEWNDLVMANYKVEPSILKQFLPFKTALDFFNGDCYVSLVAFMFNSVRIKGFKIPFHVNFPEVNLRFYVRYRDRYEWKRGVVFVREIVPSPAIAFVANTLYKERYASTAMRHSREVKGNYISIQHQWKWKGVWNSLDAQSLDQPAEILGNSIEDFITDHYWGYSSVGKNITNEYAVEHPKWLIYPMLESKVSCDFAGLYGRQFQHLGSTKPDSVFHAAGSPILIRGKTVIR